MMDIPWEIQLYAWLPFPIIALVGICFSVLYICCYQKSCLCFSGITSVILISLSFVAIIIVPVDVFLVSATKENGRIKEWASNDTIEEMENVVSYIYYGLYGILLFICFIILPCAYFSVTEPTYDDENGIITQPLNVLRGLKYSFFGLLILAIIVTVGILVPMPTNFSLNITLQQQLDYVNEIGCTNILKNGSVFAINCLGIIGMICSLIYTAYGMTILPVNLLKGKPSTANQTDDIQAKIDEINENILEIREKVDQHQPLKESDRRLLCHYSLQLSTLQSQSDDIRHQSYSSTHRCKCIVRPLQIVVGFIMILVSWFLVITIVISNINRLISSEGLHSGYILDKPYMLNPINEILLQTHKYFPMDSILLALLMFYFAVSTVTGMQHIGIWCLLLKVYKIRFRHSSVKALLFSSFILMLVTIYILCSIVYSLAPQYTMYGGQQYNKYDSNGTEVLSGCSVYSPADECLLSRLMTFQIELYFRIWIFGAAYYYGSWLFVLVFIIGFVVSVCRARKTIAVLIVKNLNEDFETTEQLLPQIET